MKKMLLVGVLLCAVLACWGTAVAITGFFDMFPEHIEESEEARKQSLIKGMKKAIQWYEEGAGNLTNEEAAAMRKKLLELQSLDPHLP